MNADSEVTSHRSEILSRSEISNRFEFTSGLMKRALKQGFIHFSGGSIVDFEHIKAGYVKSTLA